MFRFKGWFMQVCLKLVVLVLVLASAAGSGLAQGNNYQMRTVLAPLPNPLLRFVLAGHHS
jgi:hypothetical protein